MPPVCSVFERKVTCDWNKQKFGEEKYCIFLIYLTISGLIPPGEGTSNLQKIVNLSPVCGNLWLDIGVGFGMLNYFAADW